MSDWQTDFRNTLEGLTQEIETIAQELSREAIGLVDQVVTLSDDFMMNMTTSFTRETPRETSHEAENLNPIEAFLDRDLEEFLNSLLRPFVDLTLQDFQAPHHPIPKPHPLCANCENYHGQTYGGHHLVCGIHPYGISEDQTDCPDRLATADPTVKSSQPDARSNFPPDWWNS